MISKVGHSSVQFILKLALVQTRLLYCICLIYVGAFDYTSALDVAFNGETIVIF